MAELILLEDIQLVPVLELAPYKFAAEDRKRPSIQSRDAPEAWARHWADSLADSGITGLQPLRPGSWHVPTQQFGPSGNLRRFLEKTLEAWEGIDSPSDLENVIALSGGLALRSPIDGVLVEPQCCADLENANEWKAAAAYRGTDWEKLWIGHPWLSVRYQSPWLVVSEPHEAGSPTGRWAVWPDELSRAVDDALAALERLAGDLARLLPPLGYPGNPALLGRRLAGLSEQ